MLSNFSKTGITLPSVVRNIFCLVPQLRLRQDYNCVLSDLFLYSFAIFFCQSKDARVKMNAPSLVFAKKRHKKKGKHLKLQNFIADLYFRKVSVGFPINICLITSSFGRKIIV